MSAVLAVESVGKRFGDRVVLKTGSLWAEAGAVTCVVGRNGSGKSTLMRIAAGWLAPDHGTVHFMGEVYENPRLHLLARRGLFYLPDRDVLTPGLPVGAQLRAFAGRYGGDARGAAELLGIAGLADRRPRGLSGGETRRAEVALAFARRPACLVADEPFRGVDPRDAESLALAFRALAERGCAVVISGHEVPTLFPIADRLLWVTSGATEWLGTPAEARRSDRFRREYLGG
ncbi:MAG TPA: ABC transporter ATP-binding protein [Longimicrobiaceae bacterium]|nr:ABC transporter ATP-binding protein [Longimicrobiaceae bacterium]